VAIIGGGVAGASAAWFLARAGASVLLVERAALAAGASGRNSGVVQHPLEPVPGALYRETLEIYRRLALEDELFALDDEPAGLLLIATDEQALRAEAAEIARRAPELEAHVLSAAEARELEPALAPRVAACRLETGYPLAPSAATLAFARRAERAGATLRLGESAAPAFDGTRATGVLLSSGELVASGQVLLAAGPWTPELVPGWQGSPPIRPVWGVVVGLALERPPAHVLEELGIGDRLPMAPTLFSLVTAGGQSGLGSIWLEEEPQAELIAGQLLERGRQFVPAIAGATVAGLRACARPTSFDRRPLVGRVSGHEALFVCAGHGPWGISTAPARLGERYCVWTSRSAR
jgi:D-hydroxyproline dehydrogenase subunit beta